MFRLHWDVVFAIFCRPSVLVGIYPEDVEVAFVTRPCPVVGVSAVFAYSPWRAAYQTHVTIHVVFKHNILIARVKRHYLYLHVTLMLAVFRDFLNVFRDNLVACLFVGDTFENIVCDICDINKERHCQARVRQLFGLAVSPKTVSEIVVLHSGMGLDITQTAVMVSKQ